MNRLLVALILPSLAATGLGHAQERSASTSFSLPTTTATSTSASTDAAPAEVAETQPPIDPFAPNPGQQAEEQKRLENAKILERLTFDSHTQAQFGDHQLSIEQVEAIVKSNRILKQGLKGPDAIIFGYVETVNGEVRRSLSLVMPITASSAAVSYDDTLIAVKKLEAQVERDGQQLSLDYTFGIYKPLPIPDYDPDKLTSLIINGVEMDLETLRTAANKPNQPAESTHEIRSSYTLQRNNVGIIGGLTRESVTTNEDGNDTSEIALSTFWLLW